MRLFFFAVLLSCSTGFAQDTDGVSHVVFPAIQNSSLSESAGGRILIQESNCVACHQESNTRFLDSKKSPRLMNIGRRANPDYLEKFIADPHSVKPGTTMPQALSHLSPSDRKKTASEISQFLVSLSGRSSYQKSVPDAVAAEVGESLFHSVGCAACHSPRDAKGQETMRATSTPLGDLTEKYSFRGLVDFLSDPHGVRPSGRMPDLHLPRRQFEQIAYYLLRDVKVPGNLRYTLIKGRVWEGLELNVERVRAGHVADFDLKKLNVPHNSAVIYAGFLQSEKGGEAEFFIEANGANLLVNDKPVIELEASNRRGVKKASGKSILVPGWNKIRLTYYHTGRDPKFNLEFQPSNGTRAALSSKLLTVSTETIPPHVSYVVDAKQVKSGQAAFVEYGCVACHNDVANKIPEDVLNRHRPAPALSGANLVQGCLSKKPGNWPRFSFSLDQQESIRKALKSTESVSTPSEKINNTLVKFNCIACHDRKDLGGVTPERNSLFTGSRNELGNDGRIPPPLTGVGAKLKKTWMAEVLRTGRRQRPYLATTMPQFGEENIGHLTDLFEKVDSVEPVKFEKIRDIKKVKAAGHLLMGTTGFSCIACHDFNGQDAAGPGAMELIYTTERIKKDWFYHFMLKPNRFKKGTIMPESWPGGHVFMEEILDGDAKKQIESIWVYLEDGERAKNPIGLSRKAPQLRVADETLISRGRGNAGYRGMAVGYPERVSLAFDTQELNLRVLWRGEFVNVDYGRFSVRGRDRIEFPAGIPFHRLKSLDDSWPYKRKTDYLFPQDQGYRYLGYSLDQNKRPTLEYRYGDVLVKDFFEDKLDDNKKAYFKRTMTFESPTEQKLFYFRAGSGKKIDQSNGNTFQVDGLSIAVQAEPKLVREKIVIREGEPQELLIPLTLPKGKTVLTLEYKW